MLPVHLYVQCLQWTVLLPARGRAVAGAMADEQALSTIYHGSREEGPWDDQSHI